jgi:hypothetical protein
MASFLVLYHAAGPPKDKVVPSHAEISGWLSEISSSVLYGGKQIKRGVKVKQDNIQPLSPEKSVNNYVILLARDKAEALELSRSAPTIYEGGSAEVYEIGDEY